MAKKNTKKTKKRLSSAEISQRNEQRNQKKEIDSKEQIGQCADGLHRNRKSRQNPKENQGDIDKGEHNAGAIARVVRKIEERKGKKQRNQAIIIPKTRRNGEHDTEKQAGIKSAPPRCRGRCNQGKMPQLPRSAPIKGTLVPGVGEVGGVKKILCPAALQYPVVKKTVPSP